MSQKMIGGDWLDYRRDHQLSGASLAKGSSTPQIPGATYPIGGSFQEIVPIPDGSGDLLLASGGGLQRVDFNGQYKWQTRPFGAHHIAGVYDLDDDGELEIVTSNAREVIIVSGRTGEILWRYNVGLPLSYGTYATMFQICRLFAGQPAMQIIVPCFSHKEVLLFNCDHGARNTRLLHSLWMDDSYHPTTCIGDVNRDGVDEIVIARLGGIYVFDPMTGKMLDQTLWTSDTERRRNYGHFELADIDGDGDLEVIVLSDRVSRHIAVLDNDGHGNFIPMWDRFIQHIYPEDTTELRYCNNSVTDVNGDGLPEISVSLFNQRSDQRWWTEVIEASTGRTVTSYPDQYLRGIQDVDQDGRGELLLSESLHRTVQPFGKLSIVKPGATDPILWQKPNARFAERTIGTSARKSQFKPDVFANDEVWFGANSDHSSLLLFDRSEKEVSVCSIDTLHNFAERVVATIPDASSRVALIAEATIYVSQANGDILYVSDRGSKLFLKSGYHLTTEAHISARPGATPTVVNQNGITTILVPTFDDHILGLEYRDGAFVELFRLEGRSRLGYDNVFHSPSIIDFEGEAHLILIDDRHLSCARLSLHDMTGRCARSYEFRDLPPHTNGSRIGLYDWLPFAHSSGPALMISVFRSASMNSEYTRAISLATGEILWDLAHSGEGEYGRGVGAWGVASMHDRSGRPEAVFCAKDTIIRLDLETGKLNHEPRLLTSYTAETMKSLGIWKEQGLKTWSSIEDPFTAYGSIMLHDIDSDGVDELIAVGSFGGFGVLRDSMECIWWHVASFGDVLYRFPALLDLDGDSRLELVQGHSTGDIVVYDPLTGNIKHRLSIGGVATDCISADIDGDGIQEAICGTNDGSLLVLGMIGDTFSIKQQWELPSAAGSPVVAELDGKLAILVVTADGVLRSFS